MSEKYTITPESYPGIGTITRLARASSNLPYGNLNITRPDGTSLVNISLQDGTMVYGEGYEPDLAARILWEALRLQAKPQQSEEWQEEAMRLCRVIGMKRVRRYACQRPDYTGNEKKETLDAQIVDAIQEFMHHLKT
jgi:hypothetical protein